MDELQFLCFTYACHDCGLISWWDLTVEEFEIALNRPDAEIKIGFSSNINLLEQVVASLPDGQRERLQSLIDSLTPKKES